MMRTLKPPVAAKILIQISCSCTCFKIFSETEQFTLLFHASLYCTSAVQCRVQARKRSRMRIDISIEVSSTQSNILNQPDMSHGIS